MIEVSSVAEQAGIGRFLSQESVQRRTIIGVDQSWDQRLNSMIDRVDRADIAANIARHRKWLTVMRFFMGEQLGFVADDGQWKNITRDFGDPIYIVNLVQYFVNALLKDYARSQAVFDVTARGGRMDMRLAARPAAEMIKMIQSDQMGATAIERDGKFCILLGNTFRYTVCTDVTGKYRKEPVTEKVRVRLSGSSAICLDCGQIGDLPDMPDGVEEGENVGQQECQYCGSSSVEIVQGAEADVTKIAGFEERQTPDVQTSIVDPLEIKLPMSAENEILAGWLRRERYVDLGKLQSTWSWAQLSEGVNYNTGETPLLTQALIQQSPGNVGGSISPYGDTPIQQDLRKFSQYWFRPEEYADFVWPIDEPMANGEVIRKGTRALELFPNGLYVGKSGSAKLEIAPENKAEVWVHNRWEVVPNSIWGLGIDNVIQGQEMYNEVNSLIYEHIMHNTTPPVGLDPNYWKKSDWSNKPGMVAMMKKGAPSGGIGGTVWQGQARSVGGDAFNFLTGQKADMQLTAGGAFSTASGLPDVHTDTLGGMQIQRDQALAQHVSKLNRKAEADLKTVMQQLRVVKKHNLAQFYFDRLSDFSEYELKLFEQCDIDIDLEVKQRPQSWIPRSVLEQRGDLEAALTIGGLPLGIFNPDIPRALRRLGLELLGLPSQAELMAADERNTLLNITHLIEFAEMSTKLGAVSEDGTPMEQPSGPNPEEALLMAANLVPVRYRVDDHPTCIEVIIDFLKTDTGRHLSPLAELLLNDLITRHQKGMVMKMMEDAMSNPLMANPMQPNAVPGNPNPAAAQPAPMPGSAPQQQMSPNRLPGAPPKGTDATATGDRPTPAAL